MSFIDFLTFKNGREQMFSKNIKTLKQHRHLIKSIILSSPKLSKRDMECVVDPAF